MLYCAISAVLGTSTLRSLTPYRTPRSYASNRLLSSTAPVGIASELTPFRTPVNTPSTYAPPRALSSTAPLMGNYTSAPPTDALRRCVNCHGELDAHIAGHAFPTCTCSSRIMNCVCNVHINSGTHLPPFIPHRRLRILITPTTTDQHAMTAKTTCGKGNAFIGKGAHVTSLVY